MEQLIYWTFKILLWVLAWVAMGLIGLLWGGLLHRKMKGTQDDKEIIVMLSICFPPLVIAGCALFTICILVMPVIDYIYEIYIKILERGDKNV